MTIQPEKIGAYIAALRKAKQMTQTELGQRLQISSQAVSKWERGECLPDTGVLLDLAEILGTTTDSLLRGGGVMRTYSGKIRVADILEGMTGFFSFPRLVGKENTLYQGMIEGINRRMNMDWEEDLKGRDQRWCIELFAAEVISQELKQGKFLDKAEVNRLFTLDKWRESVLRYADAYGIS